MEQSDRVGGETVRKSFFVLVFLACFSGYVSVVCLPWFTLFFCLAAVINTLDSQLSTSTKTLFKLGKPGLTATLFLIGSGISGTVPRRVGGVPWRKVFCCGSLLVLCRSTWFASSGFHFGAIGYGYSIALRSGSQRFNPHRAWAFSSSCRTLRRGHAVGRRAITPRSKANALLHSTELQDYRHRWIAKQKKIKAVAERVGLNPSEEA